MANTRSASSGAAVLKPAAHWVSARMSALPASRLPLPETETPPERDEPQDLQEPSGSVVLARVEPEASPRAEAELPVQALLIVPPAIRVPHQPSLIVRSEAADESPHDDVAVDDITTNEDGDVAHLVARGDESADDNRATEAAAAAPRVPGADLVMAPRYRLAELKRERRRVADMQEVLEKLHTFLTYEAARNRARQRRQRLASVAAALAGLVLLGGVWTIARHTQERPMMPTQAGAPGPGGEATCLGASCGTLDVSMFGAAAAVDPAKSAPASPPVLALMDTETGEGEGAASDVTAAHSLPPSAPPRTARVAILETLSPLADGDMLAARETVDSLTPQDWAEPIYANLASTPAAARTASIEVAAIEAREIDATEALDACSDATCPHISEAPLATVMLPSRGAAELAVAPAPPSLVAEDAPEMDADFAEAGFMDVDSVQSLAVPRLVPGVAPHHAPPAVALAPPSVPAEDAPPTDADFADVDVADDVDSVQSLAVRGLVADVDPDPALTAQPTLSDTEAAAPVAADVALSSEAGLVLARTVDADFLAGAAGRERPHRATAPRRRPPSLSSPSTAVRHAVAKPARARQPRGKARSAQKPATPVAVIQPRGLFQFGPSKAAPAASATRSAPASKPLRKGAKASDSKS